LPAKEDNKLHAVMLALPCPALPCFFCTKPPEEVEGRWRGGGGGGGEVEEVEEVCQWTNLQ
jgi:hypothetical protein